ncbi:hypothetical protein QK281_08025 [Aeromonas hydrophila]|uniref:hypothetical protein n=1 Tax=Aeromonas hydrophila TaxID=644 RepID=UPI00249DC5CD|nr:hypothetical protein [Aeromonas hydrophila]WGY33749.1 hypothetical protein QK281_08025 [Aeromonas hydrophila]HDC4322863.1 hypothetical protein [Aeromonas hydrophila]
MHNIQQSTISDIASRFEKTLIDTPDHRREDRAKELAVEANKQARAADVQIDFGLYIPKALAAIERHEGAQQSGH